ncbi:MAG: MATE family efflux transporter [Calditrichia bacterium]
MRPPHKSNELIEGPILANVLKLATPMIVAFIFITSYNFIDRFFVSQLGDTATAAIGMAFIVQLTIISIGTGISSGIKSYISRNLGAQQTDDAVQAALHALLLAVIIGICFAILGIAIQRPLFQAIGADGELLEFIISYLTIIFLFTPVNLLSVFGSGIFQGWGDTVSPMKFSVVGTLLNIALDPILIFGLSIVPGIGIKGAALATGVARTVSLLYILFLLFVRKKPVTLSFRNFRYSPRIMRGIMGVGAPSTISQILTSISMGAVFWLLAPFGESAKAAYTIVFTYEMVIFLPAIGLAQAVSIMTGHNFGANKNERIPKIHHTGIAASFLIMGCTAGLIMLFPRAFAGVFAQSEEVLAISSHALQITAVGIVFLSIYICSVTSFLGLGLGRQYLAANFLRMYVLMLPCAYFGIQQFGIDGVWYGLAVSNIVSSVALFFWHKYIFNYKILTGQIKPL